MSIHHTRSDDLSTFKFSNTVNLSPNRMATAPSEQQVAASPLDAQPEPGTAPPDEVLPSAAPVELELPPPAPAVDAGAAHMAAAPSSSEALSAGAKMCRRPYHPPSSHDRL